MMKSRNFDDERKSWLNEIEVSIYLKGLEFPFFLVKEHIREYFKSKVNTWMAFRQFPKEEKFAIFLNPYLSGGVSSQDSCSEILCKTHRKTRAMEYYFYIVGPAILLKVELHCKWFPVSTAKFSLTAFLKKHLQGLASAQPRSIC